MLVRFGGRVPADGEILTVEADLPVADEAVGEAVGEAGYEVVAA